MAVTLTITALDEPEFTANDPRHVYETVKATGTASAAADTGTYKLRGVGKADYILGGLFTIVSQSGPTVTIKSIAALGNDAVVFRIYGKAGSGM